MAIKSEKSIIEEAVLLAESWQHQANGLLTPFEKTLQNQMARLLSHPKDKIILTQMIDQSFRSASPARVADQANYLLNSYGVPDFFSAAEKLLMHAFMGIGRHLPQITIPKMVEKMREDILLEPISSEVTDRRTGRPSTATIAFTLSYEGKNPGNVQRVANVIASLFLEENLRIREKQVTETSEFLEKEMEKVKANLSELEAKIAVFKTAHMNELPDLLQVNMQSLNNIESNIGRLNEQLRNLKEREGYLQTQLASIPLGIEEEKRDKVRLAELKLQLVQLNTRFSDQYPDVIKTKAEIAELEKQVNDKSVKTDNPGHSDNPPDNPAYITLASQLSSTQADILSTQRQIQEADKMANLYRQRILNTPKVEEAYKAILIERDNTQAKYNDLMRKHMEAKVAQGLEKDQKGERFTLIEPARLPETPYKPNRLAIMLIGMVLGIGAGVGWASLREFTDHAIRDSESLVLATSFPVLGSIPEIVTEEDIQRKKRKRVIIIVALILSAVVGLIVFHLLVMDLNVFWAKLVRKVGM